MSNRNAVALLCASSLVLGAACAGKPLPRQAPLAVSPSSFGSGEQREVTNVFVVTDASGTTYVEQTFPEARALSESFVKALPETRARAKTDSYNVGAIGFGGKDRVQAALAPFDRSSLLRTVESVDTMGEVNGRGGTTPIHKVIEEIGTQLEGKSGTTAVLLFSDGVADDTDLALDAARDDEIGPARPDRCGRLIDRLQTGGTEAIDGAARRLEVVARLERRKSRDARALLAGLRDAADHDVLDLAGIEIGALLKRLQHRHEQVRGTYRVEASRVFADPPRGSNGFEDVGFDHIHDPPLSFEPAHSGGGTVGPQALSAGPY